VGCAVGGGLGWWGWFDGGFMGWMGFGHAQDMARPEGGAGEGVVRRS